MIRASRILAVGLLALALSGCTATPVYTDLDRPATEDDAFPSDVPGGPSDLIDPDTVRLAGERDGRTYYIARGIDSGVCLTIYRSAESWVTGCGGDEVTVSDGVVTATVAPNGSALLDDGDRVGENVVVSGG